MMILWFGFMRQILYTCNLVVVKSGESIDVGEASTVSQLRDCLKHLGWLSFITGFLSCVELSKRA